MNDTAKTADIIFALVHERGVGKTICPSEVARALSTDEFEWRELMPLVRTIAGKLKATGQIDVTQKGMPVDPETAKGPIRLGLARKPQSG